MRRVVEHIPRFSVLHGAASIHYQHFIADAGHYAQIVGNHNDRRIELALQLVQQGHDLRLNGNVQRGGWLIGYQQFWSAQQRHGDHNALAHTARELMREHAHTLTRFWHFHRIEHFDRLFKGFGFAQPLMQHQDFHQLLADAHVRVQGGHRILENHRDLLGTQLVQLVFRQVKDLFAVKGGRPSDDAILRQQAH